MLKQFQHDGEVEHVCNDEGNGINIMNKPLKVGFDFDGVILYNPARVLRPFLGYLRGKKKKNGKTSLYFYHPKSKIQRFFWLLAHQTSLFPSPGLDEVRSLVASQSIEAYIITGRSSFLQADFDRRLRSIKAEKFIKKACLSGNDEQPHEYKERMIKELGLDCYVEDNWNIAQYLNQNTKARIFWITNAADDHIEYGDKYHRFQEVVEEVKKMVK